ncbi:MAG: TonB-dependent receptor [Anditalea sp.]
MKTYKLGIFVILMMLFSSFSFVGGKKDLEGKVEDKSTKMPIPGVAVFIPELNRGVVTDHNGRFTLATLPDRDLTLQFSFLGYKTLITKINPATLNEKLIIQMEETTTTIDEVVVSGAYVMSRENSPIAIEKINRDELLKMPSPSLMSSLSRTPGINEVSLGPGIGKPVIRGLSFSRVLSVYQGARFENQQWGADHGLGLNETGISSVEIIKGPASIIYGSGAMAGVIHLVEDPDAASGDIEGDINFRAYSNTLGARGEAGIKGALQNGMSWSLRGALESHADYRDGDQETIGNSRFNTQNFKGGLGLQKKWGDTRLRYSYLSQRLGLINEQEPAVLATGRNDRKMQLPFQQVQDDFVNSETNVYLGEDRLKLTLGYHWNIRKEIESYMDQVDLGLRQENFIYDMKYYKSLNSDLEAIFGVQGFYLQNKNIKNSNAILIPDANKDDRSVYGLLNFTKPKWILQGGLRYDYRKVVADASGDYFIEYDFILPGNPEKRQLNRSFDGITGSGGATFKPSERWRLRLNVASGFRAPDLAELFSNGPHPGTSRFESGNAAFEREQNVQTDLGIRYQNPEFTASLEGFYNQVNNYIFFAPTDERRGNLTVWKFEQDHARLYGGEAYLKIHPSVIKWISGSTAYSMVIGQKSSDDTYLPYIPAFKWNQEINLKFNDIDNFQQPYVGLAGSLFLDQDRAAPLEDATPGYFLLGINMGGSFLLGNQKIEAFISATNLLNRTYLDHLSLYRPFGVNQLGRNSTFHLKMDF